MVRSRQRTACKPATRFANELYENKAAGGRSYKSRRCRRSDSALRKAAVRLVSDRRRSVDHRNRSCLAVRPRHSLAGKVAGRHPY
jgi:hypothetical protein